MDERNERIVFKRIVENSVGPARPQYFLITPKLLQGLTAMEHEDVTVLFVFNGCVPMLFSCNCASLPFLLPISVRKVTEIIDE